MTLAVVETLLSSPATDLLRLLAVPVFGWAAYRDIATRWVRNVTWLPLITLGVLLLVGDYYRILGLSDYRQRLFFIRVAASVGIVAPLGYVFYRLGGFGGADAKAVMVLAVLFPTYPVYFLSSSTLPALVPPLGVFSLSILSNTVLAGIVYPLLLGARNFTAGHRAPAMFIGRPVQVPDVATEYGRILETRDGFTRGGLDLDALRMYLRWRGTTLSAVRRDPDAFRDPSTVPPPEERNAPGDGALADGSPVADGGSPADVEPAVRPIEDAEVGGERDEWGAAAFLADAGGAYGTSPETLREGLELLCRREQVWVTPGIPFIVPMFIGLLLALTFGDLLFALLSALGLG